MSDDARMASDDLGDLEVVIDDDLLGPELRLNPHAYFHRLRALDPVHWNAKYKAWVLTRYEDVVTGFRDVRLSSERIDADGFPLLGRWMVFLNPPRHTRLRRLVGNAFSPAPSPASVRASRDSSSSSLMTLEVQPSSSASSPRLSLPWSLPS